jgi:hypothetical protein
VYMQFLVARFEGARLAWQCKALRVDGDHAAAFDGGPSCNGAVASCKVKGLSPALVERVSWQAFRFCRAPLLLNGHAKIRGRARAGAFLALPPIQDRYPPPDGLRRALRRQRRLAQVSRSLEGAGEREGSANAAAASASGKAALGDRHWGIGTGGSSTGGSSTGGTSTRGVDAAADNQSARLGNYTPLSQG